IVTVRPTGPCALLGEGAPKQTSHDAQRRIIPRIACEDFIGPSVPGSSGLLCLSSRQIRVVQLAGVKARALAPQHGRDIEALKQRLDIRGGWKTADQPIGEAVTDTAGYPHLQSGHLAAGPAQHRRAAT